MGLKAHARVLYKIEAGRLIVEPVPRLQEVLKEKTQVEVTLDEFHQFRKELSRRLES